MTAELRRLWQEAFGDSEETLDKFAATGFSNDRFHCILENEKPVSALYWFDCELDGQKLAYIYAVATLQSHRGQGLAKRLMAETHAILKKRGYLGAILVPGKADLFAFYEKLGYRTATQVDEFSAVATQSPVFIQEISPAEYTALRQNYLPEGGVLQAQDAISYLATYARLYG